MTAFCERHGTHCRISQNLIASVQGALSRTRGGSRSMKSAASRSVNQLAPVGHPHKC
jgi:hypothetical protein